MLKEKSSSAAEKWWGCIKNIFSPSSGPSKIPHSFSGGCGSRLTIRESSGAAMLLSKLMLIIKRDYRILNPVYGNWLLSSFINEITIKCQLCQKEPMIHFSSLRLGPLLLMISWRWFWYFISLNIPKWFWKYNFSEYLEILLTLSFLWFIISLNILKFFWHYHFSWRAQYFRGGFALT